MNLSTFFNTEYVSYASYDNFRKIASYIDGLKASSRKVLYTFLEDKINKDIKVNRATSKVAEKTEYLHGEVSLEGVIVNMAQNFTGANNINLLLPEGSFGTRFIPKASASRYIFTKLNPIARKIFREEDEPVLEKQYFEGSQIEYKFYVPIIPMLLVNGSEGISNGFAQKILPRNLKEIIKWLKEENADLTPWYKGFSGEIVKVEGSWEIRGKFERIGRTKILITELPVSYSLKKYISVLDKLEEKKVIRSYKDLSNNDQFKFEINVSLDFINQDDYKILSDLKLIDKVKENFTSIDENNKIREFNSEIEILEAYKKIRLEYYDKRKKYQLQKLSDDIEKLEDKVKFIQCVIDGKIQINNKPKQEIIDQAIKNGIKFIDENIKMPIYNLTKEKIEELNKILNTLKQDYENLKNTDIKDIWIQELIELEKEL
jgi:DNA topoisomerase-2